MAGINDRFLVDPDQVRRDEEETLRDNFTTLEKAAQEYVDARVRREEAALSRSEEAVYAARAHYEAAWENLRRTLEEVK